MERLNDQPQPESDYDPYCAHGVPLVSRPERPGNWCSDCYLAGHVVLPPGEQAPR